MVVFPVVSPLTGRHFCPGRVNIVQWSEDCYESQLIERTINACEGNVDIVIDFAANPRSMNRSLKCLSKVSKRKRKFSMWPLRWCAGFRGGLLLSPQPSAAVFTTKIVFRLKQIVSHRLPKYAPPALGRFRCMFSALFTMEK